jgi:hypothetical protein
MKRNRLRHIGKRLGISPDNKGHNTAVLRLLNIEKHARYMQAGDTDDYDRWLVVWCWCNPGYDIEHLFEAYGPADQPRRSRSRHGPGRGQRTAKISSRRRAMAGRNGQDQGATETLDHSADRREEGADEGKERTQKTGAQRAETAGARSQTAGRLRGPVAVQAQAMGGGGHQPADLVPAAEAADASSTCGCTMDRFRLTRAVQNSCRCHAPMGRRRLAGSLQAGRPGREIRWHKCGPSSLTGDKAC